MRNRIALAALTLLLLAAPAHADEIVLNASYNENFVFPTHLETFTIPPGHIIVGATVSGTVFGFPESTITGGTTLSYRIDGYSVPTITVASTTAGFFSGSFSFSFPTSELFRFEDGSVVVGNCPLGLSSCNPGSFIESITATLTITTAPAKPPTRPRAGDAPAARNGSRGGRGSATPQGAREGLTGQQLTVFLSFTGGREFQKPGPLFTPSGRICLLEF